MTGNGGHGGADQEKTGRFVFEYELGEYFWRFQSKGTQWPRKGNGRPRNRNRGPFDCRTKKNTLNCNCSSY